MNDDGKSIRVVNDQWIEADNKWSGGIGKATVVDPSKDEGYLQVKFGRFIPAGDYKVVETDYTSYTVIYTCTGLPGIYNIEYVWILTRDPIPSQDVLDKAMEAIHTKIPKYDSDVLFATPQGSAALTSGDDCPYQTRPMYSEPSFFLQ